MKLRTRRLSSAVVLSVLCACTVGASLAWACAPSSWGFGSPSTPESTPTTGADAPAASPGSAPSSSLPPAEASPSESAQSEPAEGRARTPAKQPARSPANSPSGALVPRGAPGVAQERRSAQSSGAVARTSRSSRSASPGRAGTAGPGKAAKGKAAAAPSRSAATVQAATDGDAWSGVGGKSASLMPSASDAGTPSANAGSQLGLGAGLLGLGLMGLFGGLAVAGTRRRPALARRKR
jgi:hypothetical protein